VRALLLLLCTSSVGFCAGFFLVLFSKTPFFLVGAKTVTYGITPCTFLGMLEAAKGSLAFLPAHAPQSTSCFIALFADRPRCTPHSEVLQQIFIYTACEFLFTLFIHLAYCCCLQVNCCLIYVDAVHRGQMGTAATCSFTDGMLLGRGMRLPPVVHVRHWV
jgi:hypothetical protein